MYLKKLKLGPLDSGCLSFPAFMEELHFSVHSMFVGVSLSIVAVEIVVGVEVMEMEDGVVCRGEVSGILLLFL